MSLVCLSSENSLRAFLCIIFRRGFLLWRQPCRPIWCSVWHIVWALTGWPPTPSTSAAMLAALIRLFPKHNLWIWCWARALNFFGRPWRGLFWVEHGPGPCRGRGPGDRGRHRCQDGAGRAGRPWADTAAASRALCADSVGSRTGGDSVGSQTGADSVSSQTGADSVGSRTGSGSGVDSVGSWTGAGSVSSRTEVGSGADSVGSWTGADSVGSRSRTGVGSGVDSVGSRTGAGSTAISTLKVKPLKFRARLM